MEKIYKGKIEALGYSHKVCDLFADWEQVKDELLPPDRKQGTGNGTVHVFLGAADDALRDEFASCYENVEGGDSTEDNAVEVTHYFLPNNIISMLGFVCQYYHAIGQDGSTCINSILNEMASASDESGLLTTKSLFKLSTGASKLRPYFKQFDQGGIFHKIIRNILLPSTSYKISLYSNDEGEYAAFWLLGFEAFSDFESSCTSLLPDDPSDGKKDVSQAIYYGAPGTGKSFNIDNVVLKGVPEESKIRVTFYPDYYYSDFVGGLRPQKKGSDISYEFTAGPFTEALGKSFSEPTYLIIEEINRGNPAAIFGDIFQLLDRREDGRSRYEITNEELYRHLAKNADIKALLPEGKVFLPKDLHILCTMNTADQNVFVLDTAFKRRFRMEYVPINLQIFDSDPKLAPYKDETYPAFAGTAEVKDVMGDTGKNISEPKRNWPTFAAFVNAKIDEINSDGIRISEDKKLGPFFVSPSELRDRKKFADKVLYYLKQDVFKYEDVMEGSYEKLYAEYTKAGSDMDVFSIFDAE